LPIRIFILVLLVPIVPPARLLQFHARQDYL
jgi:hypothetical protein